jgi:hypothetical protein
MFLALSKIFSVRNAWIILLSGLSFIAPAWAQNSIRRANGIAPERQSNLFNEIIERKDELAWEFHKGDVLPRDLCKLFVGDCSEKTLPFKTFGYPLETPSGDGDGAIVLSWTADSNHPDIIILANTTSAGARFFLLSRDGALLKAASRTKDGPWSQVSNASVHNEFERESKSWHDWLMQTPHSAQPQPHEKARGTSALSASAFRGELRWVRLAGTP